MIGLTEAAILDARDGDAAMLLPQAAAVVAQPHFAGTEELVVQLALCAARFDTQGIAASIVGSATRTCRPFYGYARLAAEFAKLGEEAACRSIGRNALEFSLAIGDAVERLSACTLVARTLAGHGELVPLVAEAAINGIEIANELLSDRQDESRSVVINHIERIVAALAHSGEIEAARDLMEKYGNEIQSGNLEIARAFAVVGDIPMALQAIDRSPQNRDHFARHIVAAMVQARHIDDARRLADEITNPLERATSVMHVARSLAAAGGRTEAIDESETAIAAASLVDHGSSLVLTDAAHLLAVLEQPDRATEVAIDASEAADCGSEALAVCAEIFRLCGNEEMAMRCLADSWLRDHDACKGWRTLVQMEESVARALAEVQWGSAGLAKGEGAASCELNCARG